MTHQFRSIAIGAAVAALLILPARADSNWVTRPQKSYDANSIRIDDLVGTLTVSVKPSGPVTVEIAGTRERVQGLEVAKDGKTLVIHGAQINAVWDWHKWFDFSAHQSMQPKSLQVKIAVPKGTALNVNDMIGDATIGDTMGPLTFEAAATTAKIGRVGEAKLSMAGSGRIDVAEVNGPLSLEIAGSGKIHVGHSGPVRAEVAGAGDTQLGDIAGGLKVEIAGSGNVAALSVNGPVKVEIAGSGSIKIANGKADPLRVEIMGSGNFDFGGTAVDPHLEAFGSGRVKLKSYTGHMSRNGSVDVQVGGKSIPGGED